MSFMDADLTKGHTGPDIHHSKTASDLTRLRLDDLVSQFFRVPLKGVPINNIHEHSDE
jgi:hypothetical protein